MERAALLERLIENLEGMAYRCRHDAAWTLEFASAGSTELLGYSPHELVVDRTVAITDLIHPDDLPKISLEVERAITENRAFRIQYRIRTRDGQEKWISEVGRGLTSADGELVALEGFLTDVTDQVRAQQAVFEETRKEAVIKLANGIAHDLNNLLTGVQMVSGLVSRGASGGPLAKELASMDAISATLTRLSRQLSNLGSGQPGTAIPIDLGTLVAGCVPMLHALVGPATLDVHTEEGFLVKAEPARLEQALVNLVINARDAIDVGGKITVRVRASNGTAGLSVTDTGSGIDEAVRHKIFDPFFTTKAKERGTGLGLMVVQQVAHELGARIELESQVGRGTRFELVIPIFDAATPVSRRIAAMGAGVVLLVDDDQALRGALARGLRRLGYTVLEAADGELALRLSERHRGPIDALVTDGNMPRLSGPELASAFLEQRPTTRRILITGNEAIPACDLFETRLDKPFTVEQLAMALRRTLGT